MSARMTIELNETGTLTAATLECARVMFAIGKSRERIAVSDAEIAATKLRLKNHLARFRACRKAQVKRLAAQQRELRNQIARLKSLKHGAAASR